MGIVERSMVTITKERYDFHVAEIERLRNEIERLRERVTVLEATLEGALDSCKIWERILTKALKGKE